VGGWKIIEQCEDRLLKAILAIRDGLVEVVERLNDVLEEFAPVGIELEKITELFPEDLRKLLSFEEQADAIIIKPRKYLGSENFARIASIIRDAGGEYVSLGKASHFRLRKK